MILTLAQVCSRATEMAGGRADWALSDVSFYSNLALQEVAQQSGHLNKEAIAVSSTTSGENRYALPADFDYSTALTLYVGSNSTADTSRYTTSYVLQGQDANWADSRSLPDTGIPEHYVLYSTFFELYPSPTSAYSLQLRYMTKHPALVQSSETCLLDDRWHPAWLYKTVELLEASRNNVEGEMVAHNRFLQYVATVPTDRQLKQRDKTSMVLRYTRNKFQDG